jgi:glycosyltransferase involved in cell wall biosynthesis
LKVELVSYSDAKGGAFRATFRLHRALVMAGHDSVLRVLEKHSDDWRVISSNIMAGIRVRIRLKRLSDRVMRYQKSENSTLHSAPLIFSSGIDREINSSDSQVVNLHWINANMMSVKDIGRISKPVVWTMHDMWPFSGSEHLADDAPGARFESGYRRNNRPAGDGGLDVDRWVWKQKLKAWRRPMHIVTPSRWLAECARRSVLMRDWPISVIPNPLNTRIYRPHSKANVRKLFQLPEDMQLIAFGALGADQDYNKGFDMLLSAVRLIAADNKNIACVVFGQSEPEHAPDFGMQVYWMGYLYDDISLTMLYSAVDVMVVPSRQENLPQSGTEAQACGCPVVAFNCTGLPDVVNHKKTGYLAEAYSISDLATGISWVLENEERRLELSRAARDRAVSLWSEEVVVPQYLEVYKAAIQSAS